MKINKPFLHHWSAHPQHPWLKLDDQQKLFYTNVLKSFSLAKQQLLFTLVYKNQWFQIGHKNVFTDEIKQIWDVCQRLWLAFKSKFRDKRLDVHSSRLSESQSQPSWLHCYCHLPIIVHGNRQICKAKGARRNLRQLQSRNLATTISEQKVFLDEAVFAKKNLISFLARIKAKYLFSVMF